jgi:N-acetylglutamate synthase-like GNAT family acetyltransferase
MVYSMLTNSELQSWAEKTKNELGLSHFEVYLKGNDINLMMIAVSKDNQHSGIGSRAMNALTELADDNNCRIILSPGSTDKNFGTTSRNRLIQFYKSFGFVMNSGRNKDFAVSEAMIRNPKPRPKPMNEKLSFKRYLINEMPLPADWDKGTFNNNTPFAKQIRYAKERARQVGVGSSRVAFVLPYEGRQTVLKIAKNKKGLVQNEHEAEKMNDYYLKSLNLIIPIIDYDEESPQPSWIHTEFATKAKDSDFIKACGGTLADLCAFAVNCHGGKDYTGGNHAKIDPENEFASNFGDMVGNYDMPIGDFNRLANWGVYQGNLVIIDVGINKDIFATLYAPKPSQSRW